MTPVPTTTPMPPSEPTTRTTTATRASRIRPTGARRGRGRLTRSTARAARVRGASRIGGRPWCSRRAEPVIGSASDPTGLHHRLQEAQVLDLADGPAISGRAEAVQQGDQVARLALASSRRPRGARPSILPRSAQRLCSAWLGLQVPPTRRGPRAYGATCFAGVLWPAVRGLQSADMATACRGRAMPARPRCGGPEP